MAVISNWTGISMDRIKKKLTDIGLFGFFPDKGTVLFVDIWIMFN